LALHSPTAAHWKFDVGFGVIKLSHKSNITSRGKKLQNSAMRTLPAIFEVEIGNNVAPRGAAHDNNAWRAVGFKDLAWKKKHERIHKCVLFPHEWTQPR
jgi:hypothetical protein